MRIDKDWKCSIRKVGPALGPKRKVKICTTDRQDWFERVDLKEGVLQGAICIGTKNCIGFAKWFVESAIKALDL